ASGLTPRDIYKRAAPGVVFVRANIVAQTQSPFDLFPQTQQGEATGSGFVIDKAGTILTNAHVIQGAQKVTVQFEDQKIVNAQVVGKDLNSDLALLKVSPDGLSLDPLPLGDSKNVQVGDPTIAIGNPFGLDRTLTTGVVSALQRRIQAPNGFQIDNVIQTDAPINPGNSGGPLLDATGRVIGINSQIETGGGQGSVGIGFAVPIDTAKQVIPQLEHGGAVARAYLGLSSLTIDGSLDSLGLPSKHGALVESVTSGSPAEKAGIKAGNISAQVNGGPIELGGDIVVAVDGKKVTSSEDLGSLIGNHKPGDTVALDVLRDGKHKTLAVKLASRPNTLAATGPGG
ncbi:MAG: trypsin-like peptidase domain-containing protein, partial [Actinobacteria bacterium]|nr:trypsin-like peptidase domain-containing protein [Actinomycetota bacterium]